MTCGTHSWPGLTPKKKKAGWRQGGAFGLVPHQPHGCDFVTSHLVWSQKTGPFGGGRPAGCTNPVLSGINLTSENKTSQMFIFF